MSETYQKLRRKIGGRYRHLFPDAPAVVVNPHNKAGYPLDSLDQVDIIIGAEDIFDIAISDSEADSVYSKGTFNVPRLLEIIEGK